MSDYEVGDRVLAALRQIIRSIDIRSKSLVRSHGLTAAQLTILRTLESRRQATVSEIAGCVSLSQATVTTIVERLEARGLVAKRRDAEDRRRVFVTLTDVGSRTVQESPPVLEQFMTELSKLETWEQTHLLSALQRVAAMMETARRVKGVDLSIDDAEKGLLKSI